MKNIRWSHPDSNLRPSAEPLKIILRILRSRTFKTTFIKHEATKFGLCSLGVRFSPGAFWREVHKHLLCVRHLDHTALGGGGGDAQCCNTTRKLLNIDGALSLLVFHLWNMHPSFLARVQRQQPYIKSSVPISHRLQQRPSSDASSCSAVHNISTSYGIWRLIQNRPTDGTGKWYNHFRSWR
jgi:hypothetical protein